MDALLQTIIEIRVVVRRRNSARGISFRDLCDDVRAGTIGRWLPGGKRSQDKIQRMATVIADGSVEHASHGYTRTHARAQ